MSNNGLARFQDKKYINLTTYRKSGKAVPTPVWFIRQADRLYVYTGGQTGKAKRIRNNGLAQIAPSDARGNPQGDFIPATGRPVNDPHFGAEIKAAFRAKYGWQFRLLSLASPLRRKRIGDPVFIELELQPDGNDAAPPAA